MSLAKLGATPSSRIFPIKHPDKQSMLEMESPRDRLEKLYELMQAEIEILQVERKIRTRVKKQMERTEKEYYLNEQMRAIQKELGERDEFKNELGRVGRETQTQEDDRGSARQGRKRNQKAQDDVAHECRGNRGAQLHRLGCRCPLVNTPRTKWTSLKRKKCSTKTTMV